MRTSAWDRAVAAAMLLLLCSVALVMAQPALPISLDVTTNVVMDADDAVYSVVLPRRSQSAVITIDAPNVFFLALSYNVESPAAVSRPFHTGQLSIPTHTAIVLDCSICTVFANESIVIRFIPPEAARGTLRTFSFSVQAVDMLDPNDDGQLSTITPGAPMDVRITFEGIFFLFPLPDELGNRALRVRVQARELGFYGLVSLQVGAAPSLRGAGGGYGCLNPFHTDPVTLEASAAPRAWVGYVHPCVLHRFTGQRLLPVRLATEPNSSDAAAPQAFNATVVVEFEPSVPLVAGETVRHVASVGAPDRTSYTFTATEADKDMAVVVTGLVGMIVQVKLSAEPSNTQPCKSMDVRTIQCQPSRVCRLPVFDCPAPGEHAYLHGANMNNDLPPPPHLPGTWRVEVLTISTNNLAPFTKIDYFQPQRTAGAYNITLEAAATPTPTPLTLGKPVLGAVEGGEAHFMIALDDADLQPYARLAVDVWLLRDYLKHQDVNLMASSVGNENTVLLVALNHNGPAGRCYTQQHTCEGFQCRVTVPECLIGASNWWISVRNAQARALNVGGFAPMRFTVHAQLLTPTPLPLNTAMVSEVGAVVGAEDSYQLPPAPSDGAIRITSAHLSQAGTCLAVNVGLPTTSFRSGPCLVRMAWLCAPDPSALVHVKEGEVVFVAVSAYAQQMNPPPPPAPVGQIPANINPEITMLASYNVSAQFFPLVNLTDGVPVDLAPGERTAFYIDARAQAFYSLDPVGVVVIQPVDLNEPLRNARGSGVAMLYPLLGSAVALTPVYSWRVPTNDFSEANFDRCQLSAAGCQSPMLSQVYILVIENNQWALRVNFSLPPPEVLEPGDARIVSLSDGRTGYYTFKVAPADLSTITALYIEISSFGVAYNAWTVTRDGVAMCAAAADEMRPRTAQAYCGFTVTPCDLVASAGELTIAVHSHTAPLKFRLTSTLETPRPLVLTAPQQAAFTTDVLRAADVMGDARWLAARANKHVYAFQAPTNMAPGAQLVIKIGDIAGNTKRGPPRNGMDIEQARPNFRSDDFFPPAASYFPVDAGRGEHMGIGSATYTDDLSVTHSYDVTHRLVDYDDFADPAVRDASLLLTTTNDADAPGSWPGPQASTVLSDTVLDDMCGVTMPADATVACGLTGNTCQLRIPGSLVRLGATYRIGVQAFSFHATDIAYSLAVEVQLAAPTTMPAVALDSAITFSASPGVYYDVFADVSAEPAGLVRVEVTCPNATCTVFGLAGSTDERARPSLHDVYARGLGELTPMSLLHCTASTRLWVLVFADYATFVTVRLNRLAIPALTNGVPSTLTVFPYQIFEPSSVTPRSIIAAVFVALPGVAGTLTIAVPPNPGLDMRWYMGATLAWYSQRQCGGRPVFDYQYYGLNSHGESPCFNLEDGIAFFGVEFLGEPSDPISIDFTFTATPHVSLTGVGVSTTIPQGATQRVTFKPAITATMLGGRVQLNVAEGDGNFNIIGNQLNTGYQVAYPGSPIFMARLCSATLLPLFVMHPGDSLTVEFRAGTSDMVVYGDIWANTVAMLSPSNPTFDRVGYQNGSIVDIVDQIELPTSFPTGRGLVVVFYDWYGASGSMYEFAVLNARADRLSVVYSSPEATLFITPSRMQGLSTLYVPAPRLRLCINSGHSLGSPDDPTKSHMYRYAATLLTPAHDLSSPADWVEHSVALQETELLAVHWPAQGSEPMAFTVACDDSTATSIVWTFDDAADAPVPTGFRSTVVRFYLPGAGPANGEHQFWLYSYATTTCKVTVHNQVRVDLHEEQPVSFAGKTDQTVFGAVLNFVRTSPTYASELVITNLWANATVSTYDNTESLVVDPLLGTPPTCPTVDRERCYLVVPFDRDCFPVLIIVFGGSPFTLEFRAGGRAAPVQLSTGAITQLGPIVINTHGIYSAPVLLPPGAGFGGLVTATVHGLSGTMRGELGILTPPFRETHSLNYALRVSQQDVSGCSPVNMECTVVNNGRNSSCTYSLFVAAMQETQLTFGVREISGGPASFTVDLTYEDLDVQRVELNHPKTIVAATALEPHYLVVDVPQFAAFEALLLIWDGSVRTFLTSTGQVPSLYCIPGVEDNAISTTHKRIATIRGPGRVFITVAGSGTLRAIVTSDYLDRPPVLQRTPLRTLVLPLYPGVPVTRAMRAGEVAIYRTSAATSDFVVLHSDAVTLYGVFLCSFTADGQEFDAAGITHSGDGDVYHVLTCHLANTPCTLDVEALAGSTTTPSRVVDIVALDVPQQVVLREVMQRIVIDTTDMASGDVLEVEVSFDGSIDSMTVNSNDPREATSNGCDHQTCLLRFLDFTSPIYLDVVQEVIVFPARVKVHARRIVATDLVRLMRDQPWTLSETTQGESVNGYFWRPGQPRLFSDLPNDDLLGSLTPNVAYSNSPGGDRPYANHMGLGYESTPLVEHIVHFTVPSGADNVVIAVDSSLATVLLVAAGRVPRYTGNYQSSDYDQISLNSRMQLFCMEPGEYYGTVVVVPAEYVYKASADTGVTLTLSYTLPTIASLIVGVPQNGHLTGIANFIGSNDEDINLSVTDLYRLPVEFGKVYTITATGDHLLLTTTAIAPALVATLQSIPSTMCRLAAPIYDDVQPSLAQTAVNTVSPPVGIQSRYISEYYVRVSAVQVEGEISLPATDYTIAATEYANCGFVLEDGVPMIVAAPLCDYVYVRIAVPSGAEGSRVHVAAAVQGGDDLSFAMGSIGSYQASGDHSAPFLLGLPPTDVACASFHEMTVAWDLTQTASLTMSLVAPLRFAATGSANFSLPLYAQRDIVVTSDAAVSWRVTQWGSDRRYFVGEAFGDPCSFAGQTQRPVEVSQHVPNAMVLPARTGGRQLFVRHDGEVGAQSMDNTWFNRPIVADQSFTVDVRIGTDNCASRGELDICAAASGSVFVGFDTVASLASQAAGAYNDFLDSISHFPVGDACLAQIERYLCLVHMPACSALGEGLPPCASVCTDLRAVCGDMTMHAMNVSLANCMPEAADPSTCFSADNPPPGAVITGAEAPPPESTSSSVGLIVGLVLGLLAAAAIVAVGAVVWVRKGRPRPQCSKKANKSVSVASASDSGDDA